MVREFIRKSFCATLGLAFLTAAGPAENFAQTDAAVNKSVGIILCEQGGRTFRTNATLVEERDLVLGVSHFNFHATSGREMPVDSCSFRLLAQNGKPIFETQFSVAERGAERENLRHSFALDWALLRLDEEAPAKPMRVGSLANAISEDEVELHAKIRAGQPSDPEPEDDCELTRARPSSIVIRHQCETRPGFSGAPLIFQTEQGPAVVAVHAKRGRGYGIAVGIEGWLKDAIQEESEDLT